MTACLRSDFGGAPFMLSITSDYATSVGCPEPYLRRIGQAGFSHVHWCHHWDTDFVYFDCEIRQAADWLRDFGLRLNDLHASHGQEKDWGSATEHQRLAGVDLIKNRIDMTARLGADVVILHLPSGLGEDQADRASWSRLRRSLDALEPYARACQVRIAIENGDFEAVERVLAAYDPGFLGLCYDSGHGNMVPDGLDRLESLRHRLISVHLHDNDGVSDQHKLPFTGTVDWSKLARIVAGSSYTKCVSLETTMRETGIDDEDTFLARAFEAGTRLAHMIEEHRQATSR